MPAPTSRGLAVPCASLVLALALAACGSADPTDRAAGVRSSPSLTTGYPVSIQNCGRTLTFDSAPERVVSLWQAPTEMLLALGLKDHIVAVAGNYADYPAAVADDAKSLKVIGSAMGWPSKEVLLSEAPDLAIGQSLEGFAFDTAQGYASVKQIEATGAAVYGANLCTQADAQTWNLESSSKALTDFGKIFDVSDRAGKIVAGLARQKKAVTDAVAGRPDVKVAYFNGGKGTLIVLAGGIYDDAISTAGGTNVFPADSVYVSKEEFGASAPDVILVGTFPGQDFTTLRDYLRKTFPDMAAVRSGRMVEVPTNDTDASVGVMRGLTEIANALHPDLDLPVPTR